MRHARIVLGPALPILALLVGCGQIAPDPGGDAGGASTSEAQQLNDAAAMLEADSTSANVVDDGQNAAAAP